MSRREPVARSVVGRWGAPAGVGAILVVLGVAVGHVTSGRAEPPRGSASPGSVVIEIKNFEFVPAQITVPRGSVVRWVNADVANHQVTTGVADAGRARPDGRVASPLMFRGDGFSASFATPGEHPYYCGIHPFMRGTIVVR